MKLLIEYLALCWFKNDPTDLTPHRSFMVKVIIFYLLSGFLVEGLIADVEGILEVLLRIIMAFSSIAVLLFIIKKRDYFNQLFTAIFVCENFIMTLAVATEALDHYMIMHHATYREEVSISLATFLVFWYLTIVAYILRKLFFFKISQSLMLAVGYFVLTYGIPMMLMDM